MNRTIDEGAIRKLVLAFVLVAVVVIGSVVAVAVTDSDGAITEQEVIRFNTSGATSGSLYDSSGDKIMDITVTLTEGTNATYVVRGSNFPGWAGWTSDHVVMRTSANGGIGYSAMELKYFKSEWGTTLGGITSPRADSQITLSFRICGTYEWSDKMDGTTEFSVEFSTYAVTQYTYSTSISYDANGGSNAPSKTATNAQTVDTYPSGTDAITIPTSEPTWEGHTFLGWSASTSGSPSIKPGSTQQIDKGGDITVYAQWKIKTALLYLMVDGKVNDTLSTDWGTSVTITSDKSPAKAGYTFLGWSETEGSTAAKYYAGDSLTLSTDEKRLYAVWEKDPIQYALVFDPDNGDDATKLDRKTTDDSVPFTIPEGYPSKEGYECIGWSDTKGGAKQYVSGEKITLTSDSPVKTIYAVWVQEAVYKLTFDANGGTGAPDPEYGRSITGSADVEIPDTTPTLTGYTFAGWAVEGSNEARYQPGDTVTLKEAATVFHAVWSKIPVTFTLRFVAEGASDVPTVETVTTQETRHVFDIPATVPTKTGYKFLYWTDASGKVYEGTATVYDSSPTLTLTAEWEELDRFVLSFDANEGENAPGPVTGYSETSGCTVTTPIDIPTRTNYRFAGWTDGTATVMNGASYTMTAQAVTLKAVWEWSTEITFTVTFDANGGTDAPTMDPVTVTAPSYTKNLPNGKPSQDGFDFAGWSHRADATSADYVPGGSITLTVPETTLYAVWLPIITYTVTFDANGGTDAPGHVSGKSSSGSVTLELPADVPKKADGVFRGWSRSAESVQPEMQPGQTVEVRESMTLYAIWKDMVVFTLAFDANGGTDAPVEQSGSSDAGYYDFPIPADVPTWAGHVFKGWALDPESKDGYYMAGGTFKSIARSTTLYAVWKELDPIEFKTSGSLTARPGGEISIVVSTVPSDAVVTEVGEVGWMEYKDGKITGTAASVAGDYQIVLEAVCSGYKDTVYAVTVKVLEPESSVEVQFIPNGGTMTSTVTYVIKGGTLTEPDTPERDGFAFVGWYMDDKPYDFSTPVTGSELKLVAHWSEVGESKDPKWLVVAGIMGIAAAFVVARRFV